MDNSKIEKKNGFLILKKNVGTDNDIQNRLSFSYNDISLKKTNYVHYHNDYDYNNIINININSFNNKDNLSLLQDNINIGYSTIILNFLFLISIICAIYIIISKNPIISILYLIGLFISIACYLIIIGINFIGLSYLLIYIGAVSILFIFILMLINIRISELVSNNINSVPLVIIVSLIINGVLYNNFPHKNIVFNMLNYKFDYSLSNSLYEKLIFNVLNIKWDSNILNINNINSLGNIIYTNFPILLILASVILLLGMVGAIIITIRSQSLNSIKNNNNSKNYKKK